MERFSVKINISGVKKRARKYAGPVIQAEAEVDYIHGSKRA